MFNEHRLHLLKVLIELDYVIDDMKFEGMDKSANELKSIRKRIVSLDSDLNKLYKNEQLKWQ